MSKNDFSDVLAKIPYGVSVVTMGRGGAQVENGLTISWLSQVSFEPPLLMVAVDKLHYSVDLLRSTKNFCVNLLGEEQAALAARFARQATTVDDKLADVPQRPADSGAAILTDAVAYFDCEVTSMVEAGDHMVVIGRIEDAAVLRARAPLTSAAGLRYRKRLGRRTPRRHPGSRALSAGRASSGLRLRAAESGSGGSMSGWRDTPSGPLSDRSLPGSRRGYIPQELGMLK